MLAPAYCQPPKNLNAIRERHAKSRGSASPSESEYRSFVNNVLKAPNEATMLMKAGTKLLKESDESEYLDVYNQAFTAFPKEVGFNNGLSAPQPDYVEGLTRREYDPFPVTEVSGAVLYKDDPYSLTLPHLAGEWKGTGKDMEEGRVQSAYDGAALVYVRGQALDQIGKRDPPGHAAVTTFTTDGTNANFYAHYAAPSKTNKLEYHQYQYATANLVDSYQGFKDGRKGLRNQQDYARRQSKDLRDQLVGYWNEKHPLDDSALEETDACEYDDPDPVPDPNQGLDPDVAGYPVYYNQPTPAASNSPPAAGRASRSRKRKAPAPAPAPQRDPSEPPRRKSGRRR